MFFSIIFHIWVSNPTVVDYWDKNTTSFSFHNNYFLLWIRVYSPFSILLSCYLCHMPNFIHLILFLVLYLVSLFNLYILAPIPHYANYNGYILSESIWCDKCLLSTFHRSSQAILFHLTFWIIFKSCTKSSMSLNSSNS